MHIRFYPIAGLLITALQGHAQSFMWAAPVVGGGVAKAVTTDAAGNVYSCGHVFSVVDFDPGPGEVLSPPNTGVNGDLYVVKYDPNGNYLWHYLAGGSSLEIAKNIVVDGNGDILVSGVFTSFFDWDPGPAVVQIATTSTDGFVLKLTPDGTFLWVQRMGGSSDQLTPGLTVDDANNVYVSGYCSGPTSFGEGAVMLPFGGGVWDAFYAKYGPDGSFKWAKSVSGTGIQRDATLAYGDDRLYLYGTCSGNTVFSGTDTLTLPASPSATYLCKLDTAGSVLWVKSQTATGNMSAEAVRTNGTQLYVFASFRNTVDADPGDGALELVAPGSGPQTLFAQLDTSGNAVWAHQLQGNIHFDAVGDIAIRPEGGVVVTCAIAQTQDYDPGPGEVVFTPVQPNDLFVASYAIDGSYEWVRMITTGMTFDTSNGAAVDAEGNVLVVGSFGDSAVFDPGPLATFQANQTSEAFTAKYGADMSTHIAATNAIQALHVQPNPANGMITVFGAMRSGDVLLIADCAGRTVMNATAREGIVHLSVDDLAPGLYTVLWNGSAGMVSTRFVVER
ncbi:MAG: SBBP repeat-containing protein [Flavobacteriales bacterium]